jgi:hypothetical protein
MEFATRQREATMTVPAAGWYIDPQDGRHLRWWSGQSWTEHKSPNPNHLPQSLPVDQPSAAYVPMATTRGQFATEIPSKLTRAEKDRQIRHNNSLAYTGCVMSLVAFFINPFAVVSILGIVFSAIGLAKSHDLDGRQRVTGRGTAITGIVLGLVGLAAFAWSLLRAAQGI